jgi:hypothetical protein
MFGKQHAIIEIKEGCTMTILLEYEPTTPNHTSDRSEKASVRGMTASTATMPEWCQLRYFIGSEIDQLLKTIDSRVQADPSLAARIVEINTKIERYNSLVPNIYLQKSKLPMYDIEAIAALANQWG